ncbi:hypothetical protein [Microbacterium suaedae]|uniref:hypothetical protein n=1 Tax=Microbacterium suaedae TaxID=2067813 RepID=UPI000DA1B196|nr:hypothetical protein [Microbacterium suaedae]
MAEDEERELAALRRRVYGADADLAGDSAAVARLAELERAGRAGAVEDRSHGGAAARADPDATDPAAGERDGPSGVDAATWWDDVSEPAESGHGASGSAFEGAPLPHSNARSGVEAAAAGSEDLAARAARSRAPEEEDPAPDPERTRPRWLSPALVATSAIVAIVIMLVAGGAGWGGGFLAGWARASAPAEEVELVTVLEEKEMTEGVIESLGDMAWLITETDPETGEPINGAGDGETGAYFGTIGESAHVFMPGDAVSGQDRVEGTACIQIVQVREDESTAATSGYGGACGSARLGVTVDVHVVEEVSMMFGPGIVADDFPPGTMLRLIYDRDSHAVAVWSLPPEPTSDPGA